MRARVLPDSALPRLPRARARYRGWSVFHLVFPFQGVYPDCAYTPARLGVFMLQLSPDLEDPQDSSEKTVVYLRVRTRRHEWRVPVLDPVRTGGCA